MNYMIDRRSALLAGIFNSGWILKVARADVDITKQGIRPDDLKSPSNKDYLMVISLPGREFGKGPMMLTCEFQNHSEKPIVIYQSDFGCNHSIILKDGTGNEPKLTKLGSYLKERFKNGRNRDQNIPVNVLTGKTSHETIDLARCYEFRPGKYRVKVLFREWCEKNIKAKTKESIIIEIESNELEFVIKE